jgi:hypothetical protein
MCVVSSNSAASTQNNLLATKTPEHRGVQEVSIPIPIPTTCTYSKSYGNSGTVLVSDFVRLHSRCTVPLALTVQDLGRRTEVRVRS